MGEIRTTGGEEDGVRRLINNDLLTLCLRLLVGVVFIYASLYKILDPGAFAKSIWYYHLVPGDLINLIALVLPWVELLCGLCLILGVFYHGAVVWVNVLTLTFIFALSTTIVRGIDIDCGCFKAAKVATESAWEALWFDIVLLVFTLQLLFSRSRRWILFSRQGDVSRATEYPTKSTT
jgi:putative oxidoreductase